MCKYFFFFDSCLRVAHADCTLLGPARPRCARSFTHGARTLGLAPVAPSTPSNSSWPSSVSLVSRSGRPASGLVFATSTRAHTQQPTQALAASALQCWPAQPSQSCHSFGERSSLPHRAQTALWLAHQKPSLATQPISWSAQGTAGRQTRSLLFCLG